jgi:LacI family transcriptional regulator
MAVSIQDIAKKAKVSNMTVSNVLRNQGGFSVATKTKVLSIADSLGYRPHAGAVAIRSGRFSSVGLVRSEIPSDGHIPNTTMLAIEKEISKKNLHLVFGLIPEDKPDQVMPKILRELAVDGMLISYTSKIPAPLRNIIHNNSIPAIWLNVKHKTDCVHPDDFGFMRTATQKLIDLGHRRISYIGWEPSSGKHYSLQDRFEGYRSSMVEAGLSPDPIWAIRDSLAGYSNFLPIDPYLERFRRPDRPTAVLTQLASETLTSAWQAGLRLPQELSIISLQELASSVSGIALSAGILPSYQVGKNAVRMLLSKIENSTTLQQACSVPVQWMEGETLGPPS